MIQWHHLILELTLFFLLIYKEIQHQNLRKDIEKLLEEDRIFRFKAMEKLKVKE